jgi:LPXTG-motif cell wall-anchored protein
MAAQPHSQPSFSPRQRWSIVLNVCLTTLVLLLVVVMLNFLGRDYFLRLYWSTQAKTELSPLTVHFLRSLTNQVKVTLFYDKQDALYGTIANLLNQYQNLAKPRLTIQAVDYLREPGTAQKVRADYQLGAGARNLIIFDCEGKGRRQFDGNELTKGVAELVRGEKEPELWRKPTEFLGERAFTSALIAITNPRPNAYFLEDHRGEHGLDRGDDFGYRTFKTVLEQNYIHAQTLSLLGTNLVPADCHLLVVAGAQAPFSPLELEKIDQYLSQGGRLLALFNASSVDKRSRLVPYNGLEAVLAKWGIEVGNTIILDPQNSPSREGFDMIISAFSPRHPVVNPLLASSGLYMLQPRKVGNLRPRAQTADAPRVEELAYSSPKSFTTGAPTRRQPYPVMVALENTIRGVTTERGSTRMLVVGDSLLLANGCIDKAENRAFAGYAANWLLDRMQLLQAIGPRPVRHYQVLMTKVQMQTTQVLLLAGLPGAVLLLGGLVWLRRRR